MDFSQTQRDPTRKFVGLGAVIVFHIIIVYALITGLARKVVEVVKGPIEVKVIEEVIKKPPPPPELLPPPPKMQAPPPPFIPPPEINIQPPPHAGAHHNGGNAGGAAGSAGARDCTRASAGSSNAGCAKRCGRLSELSGGVELSCLSARSCRSTIFRARYWPNSLSAPTGRYATSSSRAVRIGCSTSPRYK